MQMGVNYYQLQHLLAGVADLNLSGETLKQILILFIIIEILYNYIIIILDIIINDIYDH
jgi:hypothetical protein